MKGTIRFTLGSLLGAVVSICVSASSCDKEATPPPVLILKNAEVGAEAASQFIGVQASGFWRIEVAYEGTARDWVEANPSEGNGNSNSVVLSYDANTGNTARQATIVVRSSSGISTVRLSQKGKSGGADPDPSPVAGWLELPAIPDDSPYKYVSHSMKIGSVRTRNYEFVWDYDNLVAPWVAYPLSNWTIGNGGRTNAWQPDPKIPSSKQPVLNKGYEKGNAGFKPDRGHQIPSADRLTRGNNEMTFYFTNMTPQRGADFNQSIWANLEGKVRGWADRSDTLYVVTGCVTDGSTKYATDNVGKKVTVPVAYYKAVLRYSRKSTFGVSGYSACAIWMEHKDYEDANVSSSYALSIDELEKKTGWDFFANLPAKIGESGAAQVEAQDPKNISWWW